MFAYIKGEIIDISEDNLTLEANQIGYNIRISTGTAGLLPSIGEEVKIYTYTVKMLFYFMASLQKTIWIFSAVLLR